MKGKSIIFFDIDGTLLDHDKKLPSSAKQAIAELKKAGHIVAIATGRAPFMFKELRETLGIDTYVSFNGQYVVLEGQTIYRNPLDSKALEALTEDALGNDHPVVYLDEEDMMSNVPEHEYITEGISTLKLGMMPGHDPTYHETRTLYQTLLFCPEGEDAQYEEKHVAFDFIRWHPVSIDVLPKGGSKALGIEKITTQLGISDENQYAFGDGPNDLEMLSAVHHSVAMGNAADEVKSYAKYVTKDVDEDGLLHGLKMVGLIE
ncbi:Cof-type HAD-IIB family hydrolase [Salinicoccus jeotgali]|uniref:Cof-type HAD-IIB family hydrolase n=1 Tax=Salinicoccus jeotgali TaxID=381634 RepID=A0ABP7F0Y0_9STAP